MSDVIFSPHPYCDTGYAGGDFQHFPARIRTSWSAAYNSDGAPGWAYCVLGKPVRIVGWYCTLEEGGSFGYGVRRGSVYFDTTALPADAAISAAKITLRGVFTGFHVAVGTPVMDVIHCVRAPGLSYPVTDGSSEFRYLRGCGVKLGGLLISPSMDSTADYEIPFNAAGIASIIKAGITKIGFRADSDTPGGPYEGTRSAFRMDTFFLVVTYEEAGALKVVTLPATDVTKDALTVNGGITQGTATKRGFDWGESADALINEWYEEGTFGVEEFSHAVTGLTPGQEFCHRAKAAE